MAHLHILREFHARSFVWRDRLPLDCLLCRSRTPGGLCPYCREAVCGSMAVQIPRCGRCELRLALRAEPGLAPEEAGPADAVAACPDCATLVPSLSRVVAAFDYDWPGDLLIRRLKLQGRFSAAPLLAGLLAQRGEALRSAGMHLWDEHHTLVTAVPAGRVSLIARGYNPAAEVGRVLARRLRLAWRPGLVLRGRDGDGQKHLGRRARRRAVQGLYHCPGGVAGREVLVVDDVMTTGSTLSAIAGVLAEQGAAQVWGAVLARTPAHSTG